MAGKTNTQREAEARAKGQWLVYQRHYRPSEKCYGTNLTFYKGFNTQAEAIRCVQSNPQKYAMQFIQEEL